MKQSRSEYLRRLKNLVVMATIDELWESVEESKRFIVHLKRSNKKLMSCSILDRVKQEVGKRNGNIVTI